MHPILFHLGIPIHSYGTMLGLAIVLGAVITFRQLKTRQISRNAGLILTGTVIIAGLVGARLLHLMIHPPHSFVQLVSLLVNPQAGGMVSVGGYFGGAIGGLLACRKLDIPFARLADAVIPAVALGLFLGRIGCFLYGCDFGRPVTPDDPALLQQTAVQFPNWAITNPQLQHEKLLNPSILVGAPAFQHHLRQGLVPFGAATSLPVIPTQLLSALNGLILLLLFAFIRRRIRVDGRLFALGVVYYGVTRFLIEFLRDDPGRGTLLGLSTAQWACLLAITWTTIHLLKSKYTTKPR